MTSASACGCAPSASCGVSIVRSNGSSCTVATMGLPGSLGLCSARTSIVPDTPMRPLPPESSLAVAEAVALSTSPTSSLAGRSNSSRTSVLFSPSASPAQNATVCVRV